MRREARPEATARHLSRRFKPRGVKDHEAFLRLRIGELLDAVADRGRLEVVDDLAAQLPSGFTAALLGFDEDRWEDVKSWSERLMRTDAVRRFDLAFDPR